jgi:hypothetical protein
LYEWCVQAPAMQARFLRALHGDGGRVLCEDFSGPASIARAWARLGSAYRGVGVDRDAEPLRHAVRRAREQGIPRGRFSVERADVLGARTKADVIAAFNFAMCELHERARLGRYLRRARGRLGRGGIFACDTYGGPDALTRGSTSRRVRTPIGMVRYTWQQRRADPLTGRVENAMHFTPARGSAMRDAFVYDWRLWSVAELRDAMVEAGFARVEAHLTYGEAIDERGDPVPRAADPWERIEGDFVAFVVGRAGR